jgi:hypothetical protein
MKLLKFLIFGLSTYLETYYLKHIRKTTDLIRQKQVFIASDSYEIFGLGTGKRKKKIKVFNFSRHLFAPQARNKIELTFYV